MASQNPIQEKISASPSLSQGEVHVWTIAFDDPALKSGYLFQEVLSEDEKMRASRLLPGNHRERFVTARGYMRTILSGYLDIPAGEIRFEYNRHGKPSIDPDVNSKRLSFNLSHSRDLALCSVTVKSEIGIDVECLRPVIRAEKILERFFSEGEREYFRTQPETEKGRAFMILWTMKEAFSKANGRGLSSELRDIDLSSVLSYESPSSLLLPTGKEQEEIWTIHRFGQGREYIAALALKGNATRIGTYDVRHEL